MLDRATIADAKLIIRTVLHQDPHRVAYCYRRTKRRTFHPSAVSEVGLLTPYVWERVVCSTRKHCWSWQVVLVEKTDEPNLPDYISIWQDDPKNGTRGLINTDRAEVASIIAQADVPLVSALMGERLNRKNNGFNDPPVWHVEGGQFLPSAIKYSKAVIGIKNKLKQLEGISFRDVLTDDTLYLTRLGFTPKEIEVLTYMRNYPDK